MTDNYLLTYAHYQMDNDYNLFYTPGYLSNIKVVNIVVDGQAVYKQSQLIVKPVPEPTTMLLFGTGLVGLAAIGREKIRE